MKLICDTKVRHYHVDASKFFYGRLCAYVASLITGKHSVHRDFYNPNKYVVKVVNLSQVQFSHKNKKKKLFRHHTGYPGGLKEISMQAYIDKGLFVKCFLVSLRRMTKNTTNFRNKLIKNLIIEL